MTERVFVAGASGAIGHRLLPLLFDHGYQVIGMTRSLQRAADLRALGAEPVVADGLDRAAVRKAVLEAMPQVIVHEMSSLAGVTNYKNFDDEFNLTNRLRTEGLDYLLEAAREAGVRRMIVQSYGNSNYECSGGPIKTEADPLDAHPASTMRRTFEAIRYLESTVLGTNDIEGIVLRYANLYGPGTSLGLGGSATDAVRKRHVPIIGPGTGVWSFVHVYDAATATVAAVERGGTGLYNVADDEPAPVKTWLPEFARAIGARPPMHVPTWVGRLAAGESGVRLFTQIRGAANDKAKRELPWSLKFPTWREGFRTGLA